MSNTARADYEAMVERAKEYTAAGDVIQVVLSQRLDRPTVPLAHVFLAHTTLRPRSVALPDGRTPPDHVIYGGARPGV